MRARAATACTWPVREREHIEPRIFTAPVLVRKLPPREPKQEKKVAPKKAVRRGSGKGSGWRLRADVTADKIRAWQAQGRTIDEIAGLLNASRSLIVTRLAAATDPTAKKCACGAVKLSKSAVCAKCRKNKVNADRKAAVAPEYICECGKPKKRASIRCAACNWRQKISTSICACGKPKFRDSKACIYCRAKAANAGRAAAKAKREAK